MLRTLARSEALCGASGSACTEETMPEGMIGRASFTALTEPDLLQAFRRAHGWLRVWSGRHQSVSVLVSCLSCGKTSSQADASKRIGSLRRRPSGRK